MYVFMYVIVTDFLSSKDFLHFHSPTNFSVFDALF